MVSYWRRRERETTDMKRKRDREEHEARKKYEEEQESIRQRKRLEYIIKQSDIYSKFMAQKLGMSPANIPAHTPSIQIDEQ
jgi:DNA helicase INO80